MIRAYIEIVGEVAVWDTKLTLWDRFRIGKFTRENVAKWLDTHTGMDPGFYPKDFHAVCGDIDIPWATEEGRLCWAKVCARKSLK